MDTKDIKIDSHSWTGAHSIPPRQYTCGYCGQHTAPNLGYASSIGCKPYIYLCTNCGCPTLFYKTNQYPGPMLGRNVEKLPDDINQVYGELRGSVKDANYTAAVLLARKLIMHLAVNIAGVEEGKSFEYYVNKLKESGYIPRNSDTPLNKVRKLGNIKNHEISIGTQEEAENILKFVEILLIFMYEFQDSQPSPEQPSQ